MTRTRATTTTTELLLPILVVPQYFSTTRTGRPSCSHNSYSSLMVSSVSLGSRATRQ